MLNVAHNALADNLAIGKKSLTGADRFSNRKERNKNIIVSVELPTCCTACASDNSLIGGAKLFTSGKMPDAYSVFNHN